MVCLVTFLLAACMRLPDQLDQALVLGFRAVCLD